MAIQRAEVRRQEHKQVDAARVVQAGASGLWAGTVAVVPTDPNTAPLDPDAFDEWARDAVDHWQGAHVFEEAARRLADDSLSSDDRALAAVWAATLGAPPVPELQASAADPALERVLRARVQAALAGVVVDGDRDGAVALIEQALPVAADTSVAVRTRASVWLVAGEVYQRAGRPGDALQVLSRGGEQIKEDSAAPEWALPAIDVERMSISARAGQDREQLARALDRVANVARRAAPTPAAIDVVVKAAGVLMGLGAVKLAEGHFEAIVEGSARIPEARAQRYRALLGMAEAVKHIDGAEAAIAVQRDAVAVVEPLGDSPMLGWARRGLAALIAATGDFSGAAGEFATAGQVFENVGLATDANGVRLEQAAALIQADDVAGARTVADAVGEAAADLDDESRTALELRLHEVYAQADTYDGETEAAAEHWLEVADRATKMGASPMEAELAAAQLFAVAGDIDEATAQFARAELSAADTPDPAKATALVMRTHAETLRHVGRADEAAELARLASNHARTSGDDAQSIYLKVIAADSLHAAGESQAAVQLYIETLAAAEAVKMPSLLGAVHAAYGKLLRDMGRTEEADEQDARGAALGITTDGSEKLSE